MIERLEDTGRLNDMDFCFANYADLELPLFAIGPFEQRHHVCNGIRMMNRGRHRDLFYYTQQAKRVCTVYNTRIFFLAPLIPGNTEGLEVMWYVQMHQMDILLQLQRKLGLLRTKPRVPSEFRCESDRERHLQYLFSKQHVSGANMMTKAMMRICLQKPVRREWGSTQFRNVLAHQRRQLQHRINQRKDEHIGRRSRNSGGEAEWDERDDKDDDVDEARVLKVPLAGASMAAITNSEGGEQGVRVQQSREE